MRQRVGEKKLRRLRDQTGLPVVAAMVRGGTDHRIDLCLEGGHVAALYRDGTIENPVMFESGDGPKPITWDDDKGARRGR